MMKNIKSIVAIILSSITLLSGCNKNYIENRRNEAAVQIVNLSTIGVVNSVKHLNLVLRVNSYLQETDQEKKDSIKDTELKDYTITGETTTTVFLQYKTIYPPIFLTPAWRIVRNDATASLFSEDSQWQLFHTDRTKPAYTFKSLLDSTISIDMNENRISSSSSRFNYLYKGSFIANVKNVNVKNKTYSITTPVDSVNTIQEIVEEYNPLYNEGIVFGDLQINYKIDSPVSVNYSNDGLRYIINEGTLNIDVVREGKDTDKIIAKIVHSNAAITFRGVKEVWSLQLSYRENY